MVYLRKSYKNVQGKGRGDNFFSTRCRLSEPMFSHNLSRLVGRLSIPVPDPSGTTQYFSVHPGSCQVETTMNGDDGGRPRG